MRIIADLHIHSKYSRATSTEMNVFNIAKWAKIKGINVVGTGDFTHPLWLEELKLHLKPCGDGVFEHDGVYFILSAEVSNIYHRKGRLRKVHNMIFAPSFEIAEKINRSLSRYGKLLSDGRPILSLDSEDLVKIVLDISDRCLIIPAHAWTPHFSVFGSNSGFDSLEECFGKESDNIYSVETGLSSDPSMNWRLSRLDNITLISNSDAHSPKNLGREANVFDIADYRNLFDEVAGIIKEKDQKKFLYTIEFFPEEGKYHFDGHRGCDVRISPKESIAYNDICPKCGRRVTVGVLHRVEQLADREEKFVPDNAIPYKSLIPLEEIIAQVLGLGKSASGVRKEYLNLLSLLGSEFDVLMNTADRFEEPTRVGSSRVGSSKNEDLSRNVSHKIVEGIMKVRKGEVDIVPGYDGVYGSISIRWSKAESDQAVSQLNLF